MIRGIKRGTYDSRILIKLIQSTTDPNLIQKSIMACWGRGIILKSRYCRSPLSSKRVKKAVMYSITDAHRLGGIHSPISNIFKRETFTVRFSKGEGCKYCKIWTQPKSNPHAPPPVRPIRSQRKKVKPPIKEQQFITDGNWKQLSRIIHQTFE